MDGLRDRVFAALDSVPDAEGVCVVQVQEDGSIKKLAERDPAPTGATQIIVLNSKEEAAARFRAGSEGVSGPSQAEEPAAPGDTPTDDEPPRGPSE